MKTLSMLKPLGRLVLIVGVILLTFTSFGGLRVDVRVPILILSVGTLVSTFTEGGIQAPQESLPSYVSWALVSGLFLAIALASYLILTGMAEVRWEEIYFFSPDIVSRLQAGYYGFPNYDFLLGCIFSFLFSGIFIASWVSSRDNGENEVNG